MRFAKRCDDCPDSNNREVRAPGLPLTATAARIITAHGFGKGPIRVNGGHERFQRGEAAWGVPGTLKRSAALRLASTSARTC
jgi:hypothetical protein